MDFDQRFNKAQQGDTKTQIELFLRLRERFRLFLQHKVWDPANAEGLLQEALVAV